MRCSLSTSSYTAFRLGAGARGRASNRSAVLSPRTARARGETESVSREDLECAFRPSAARRSAAFQHLNHSSDERRWHSSYQSRTSTPFALSTLFCLFFILSVPNILHYPAFPLAYLFGSSEFSVLLSSFIHLRCSFLHLSRPKTKNGSAWLSSLPAVRSNRKYFLCCVRVTMDGDSSNRD